MSAQPPPPAPPQGGYPAPQGHPQQPAQYPGAPGYNMVPPPPKQGGGGGGVAVIILAIVGGLVVVVGILAVLGIYGMRKYIANSKTAEARNALGQIGKDAAVAYEKESLSATVISPGSEIGAAHMLCESASESVPSSAEMIRGRKYQSTPSEWDVDRARHAGFSCLKFSMDSPQYYMYSYKASGDGTHAGDSFTATANGDLNGDGVLSTFTLEGRIVGSGASATLQITPSITEVDPQE